MSQNISTTGEIKRTYWVNDPDNISGPLVPVYDSDIGGISNQIYLERTIATDELMQNDDQFSIVNRVYGGSYPLINRYVIPPHDHHIHERTVTPSPEHTSPVAQTQDEYFADIDKMLAKTDTLISEIAVHADELDVAAILAEPSEDREEDDFSDDLTPKSHAVPFNDEPQGLADMLMDGDLDAQQPIERGFRCVTYNAQKSRKNVHYFLEKHMEEVDIVFIQEPPWGFTKKVPSSVNKEGDDYEHTVSH